MQLEAVNGRQDVLAILGGRLHDRRRSGEGHHTDARVPRLIGHEGPRGSLCCGNAAGLDVGGAHAAGGVHGEDDGFVLGRQGDHGGRSGDGNDQHGQCRQEQKRRDVAPESLARAHGLLQHGSGSHTGAPTFFLRRTSRM